MLIKQFWIACARKGQGTIGKEKCWIDFLHDSLMDNVNKFIFEFLVRLIVRTDWLLCEISVIVIRSVSNTPVWEGARQHTATPGQHTH